MKKFLKIISILTLCISVAFMCFACNPTCTNHIDKNHDGICDNENCNEKVNFVHVDSDHNGHCDECNAPMTVTHVDENDDGLCDVCKTKVPCKTHKDENHDGKCDKCDEPVDLVHVDKDHDGICDFEGCDENVPLVHEDKNHDGVCDFEGCDVEVPLVHEDKNHDGKCDFEGCEETVDYTHVDLDHDGHCDSPECNAEMPVKHYDLDGDGKCDVCRTPIVKPDCIVHYDSDEDNKCDACGQDIPETDEKTISALENIVEKLELEQNVTLNLKGTFTAGTDSKEFTFEIKFVGSSFEFLADTITLSDGKHTDVYYIGRAEEGHVSIYKLQQTVGTENGENKVEKQILERVALPEELLGIMNQATAMLNSLVETIKLNAGTAITDLIPKLDTSFIEITETDDEGYNVEFKVGFASVLEYYKDLIVALRFVPLYDILNPIVMGLLDEYLGMPLDLELVVSLLKTFNLGDQTIAQVIETVKSLVGSQTAEAQDASNEDLTESEPSSPAIDAETLAEIENILNVIFKVCNIDYTATQFKAMLEAFIEANNIILPDAIELPEATEDQTLANYIISIINANDLNKLSGIKLNEIAQLLMGDENATFESMLDAMIAYLKNTEFGQLLGFINFEALDALEFNTVDLSFTLVTDKEYAIQSLELKAEVELAQSTLTSNYTLSLKGTLSNRGKTALTIQEEVIDELLKQNSTLKNIVDNLGNNFTLSTDETNLSIKPNSGNILVDGLINSLMNIDTDKILSDNNLNGFNIKVNGKNIDIGPIKSKNDDGSYTMKYFCLRDGEIYTVVENYSAENENTGTTKDATLAIPDDILSIVNTILSMAKNSSLNIKSFEENLQKALTTDLLALITSMQDGLNFDVTKLSMAIEKDQGDDGYLLSYKLDYGERMNEIIQLLYKNENNSVMDLLIDIFAGVKEPPDPDATDIEAKKAAIKQLIEVQIPALLQANLFDLIEENTGAITNLTETLDMIGSAIGITPDVLYSVLNKLLNVSIPEPIEDETFGTYIVRVVRSIDVVNDLSLNSILTLVLKQDAVTWYNDTVSGLAGKNVKEFFTEILPEQLTFDLLKQVVKSFDQCDLGFRVKIDKDQNLKYAELYINALTNGNYNVTLLGSPVSATVKLQIDFSFKFSAKDLNNTEVKDLDQLTEQTDQAPESFLPMAA